MLEVLTNHTFINFVIPVGTTALQIFFKIVSRHDTHQAFRKEDLAVGIETIITALLLLATSTVDKLIRLGPYSSSSLSNKAKLLTSKSLDSLELSNPKLLDSLVLGNHRLLDTLAVNNQKKLYLKYSHEIQQISINTSLTPYFLVVIFVGLVSVTFVMRKWGWKAADEMTLGYGVILPNFVGLIILLGVVIWIRG